MNDWKSIEGFEDYMISSFGKIKSISRSITRSNGSKMTIRERILKTYVNQNGYEISVIQNGNTGKHFQVHRLIALAFIHNPQNKPFVNHINGIKTDNRVENLEWVTRSENEKHAHRIGLKSSKGEKHSQSILTENQVKQIRQDYNPLIVTRKYLAKKYSVSDSCIKSILAKRTWKHV